GSNSAVELASLLSAATSQSPSAAGSSPIAAASHGSNSDALPFGSSSDAGATRLHLPPARVRRPGNGKHAPVAHRALLHTGKTGLRLDPNPTAPTANDDNGANGQLYIGYESLPGPRPLAPDVSTLNVAADAGVLFNDDPGNAASVSAELDTSTANGTLQLNPDGSFSYTPDVNFVGADTFTYHLRYGPNPGDISNSATVTIGVMGYQPEAFPAGLAYSQKALIWPKKHYDVLNTGGGMYPWRSEGSLVGGAIAPEPDPINHPGHHLGSPVMTLIPDQGDFGYARPVVFVESNQGLYAVNINQDLNPPSLSPSLRWVNRDVWHADVPGQEVHAAPIIGYSDQMDHPSHQV